MAARPAVKMASYVAAAPHTGRPMNIWPPTRLPVTAVATVAAASLLLAQAPQITTGGTTFFARENGRNVTRFQGDAAQLPDGRLQIRNFRMETLGDREEPEMRVEAADCIVEALSRNASSAGPLKVSRADGLFSLEGVGFAWNQKDGRLVITNKVRAIVRMKLFDISEPAPK